MVKRVSVNFGDFSDDEYRSLGIEDEETALTEFIGRARQVSRDDRPRYQGTHLYNCEDSVKKR